MNLRVAVFLLVAVVAPGCSAFAPWVLGPDYIARPKGMGKREKPRPWVNVRPGQDYDRCAGPADLDHPKPHIEAAFFFDLLGAEIAPGDTLRVTINGAHTVTFSDFAEGPTAALTFPAGLGVHTIEAVWLDAAGGTRNHSGAYLGVWACPSK